MIDVLEAIELIKNAPTHHFIEERNLEESIGYILAEDIFSDREYPPFNRVMMDGIGVKYEAISQGIREFKISGISPAGTPALTLNSTSECIEVMTGAITPKGCDVIIPYEEVDIKGDTAHVSTTEEYQINQNIHQRGSDIEADALILAKGVRLSAPHIGIAASVGMHRLKVFKSPRINIISTGDELVEIDQVPLDYQIRRSNALALKSSLELYGLRNITLSHLKDDLTVIEEHFDAATESFDILIYSGGVSKGKFDFLPQVWESREVQKIFHRIAQRPGKPLWFGHHHDSNTIIFGLPGNPISSLVCLHRYFLPNIGQLQQKWAILCEEVSFSKDLAYFCPVRISYTDDGQILATPVKSRNSGEFSSLANTDGFVELPRGANRFEKGLAVKLFTWEPR